MEFTYATQEAEALEKFRQQFEEMPKVQPAVSRGMYEEVTGELSRKLARAETKANEFEYLFYELRMLYVEQYRVIAALQAETLKQSETEA
jgi:hypothetical protein